jgi:hypothetical protein
MPPRPPHASAWGAFRQTGFFWFVHKAHCLYEGLGILRPEVVQADCSGNFTMQSSSSSSSPSSGSSYSTFSSSSYNELSDTQAEIDSAGAGIVSRGTMSTSNPTSDSSMNVVSAVESSGSVESESSATSSGCGPACYGLYLGRLAILFGWHSQAPEGHETAVPFDRLTQEQAARVIEND